MALIIKTQLDTSVVEDVIEGTAVAEVEAEAAQAEEAPVVVIEQAEDAKEVATTPRGFLSISLKRFHRKDGRVVNPDVDGYFVPKDQEDLDILMDHMQQGRVVFK